MGGFFVSPESTGSAAHVASIMERVRSLPGTWKPGELIRVRSKPVKPLSAGHIFPAYEKGKQGGKKVED